MGKGGMGKGGTSALPPLRHTPPDVQRDCCMLVLNNVRPGNGWGRARPGRKDGASSTSPPLKSPWEYQLRLADHATEDEHSPVKLTPPVRKIVSDVAADFVEAAAVRAVVNDITQAEQLAAFQAPSIFFPMGSPRKDAAKGCRGIGNGRRVQPTAFFPMGSPRKAGRGIGNGRRAQPTLTIEEKKERGKVAANVQAYMRRKAHERQDKAKAKPPAPVEEIGLASWGANDGEEEEETRGPERVHKPEPPATPAPAPAPPAQPKSGQKSFRRRRRLG